MKKEMYRMIKLGVTSYCCHFLTARPWAERGSCFTRGFFFFGSFVGDQTQTSLGQTSNDAIYGVLKIYGGRMG